MTRTTRVTQRPNARMSTGGLRPRQQMPLSAQRPNARMSTGGLRPRKQMPLSAQRPNARISTGGRVPRRRLLFDDEPNVDSALLSRAHREEAVPQPAKLTGTVEEQTDIKRIADMYVEMFGLEGISHWDSVRGRYMFDEESIPWSQPCSPAACT